MKNSNYTVITGWMFNELHLTGNEAIIYSIIYGFSQNGNSEFSGSLTYIAESINISRRRTIDILQSLVDKGLIIKRETTVNNIKQVMYSINMNKITFLNQGGSEIISPPSEKISLGVVKKFHQGSEIISPNINNNINKDIYISKKNSDGINYKNKFNQFEQTNYDFDAYEKELLGH